MKNLHKIDMIFLGFYSFLNNNSDEKYRNKKEKEIQWVQSKLTLSQANNVFNPWKVDEF